jgi:hypothetical protein
VTRNHVIQFLREMGDQFIDAASKAGVEPCELWGVYQGVLERGMVGVQECAMKIATNDTTPPQSMPGIDRPLDPSVPRPTNFDHLRAALVQVMTASSLLIEMLPDPAPGVGVGYVTFDKGKVN